MTTTEQICGCPRCLGSGEPLPTGKEPADVLRVALVALRVMEILEPEERE